MLLVNGLQQKSLIIVKYHVSSKSCFIVELTYVPSQDYITKKMIRGNSIDFIDHHLPKDLVSPHGASHHAWAPGLQPSKSGAGFC